MNVESHDRIEPLAHEWDDLADRTRAAPWLRPGWIDAWWKAFGAGELRVLAARRDGRLAGVIPLQYRAGALSSTTNSHTPEFSPLVEDATVGRELAEALFCDRPRRISLAFLDEDKPGLSQCRAAAAVAGYRLLERPRARSPYIQFEGGWDAYEKHLSKNLRKELSRQERRLQSMGRLSFQICEGTDRLDELLDEGFRIEASGWKGARGTAIASRPETRRFYTEIAHWAAARGCLRLAFHRLDGRAFSFHFNVAGDDTYYHLKTGYDPAYRRFSPGHLTMRAVIREVVTNGFARFDLLGADDPYKLAWSTSFTEKKLLLAFAPTLPGFVDWATFAYARPLARRMLERRPARHDGGGEGRASARR
ncbi:MAG: cellulose biosynthesis [Solirubrobacterales bacterium]|jgi:CelD/BcsL family acetyltransferase involved in cellulose biosynthesis|nr:cellulose biosynthesis [Solirubrobacterales bacterium]